MSVLHSIDNNHRLPRIFEILEVGDFIAVAGLNYMNTDSLNDTAK